MGECVTADSRYARGALAVSASLILSPGQEESETRGIRTRGKRRYVDYGRGQIDADGKTVERERRRTVGGKRRG